MSFKIVQMFLRGATFAMMLIAFFLNSENKNLLLAGPFILSGVYGSYAAISLGLLWEVGLQINSDIIIEAAFVLGGVFLNLLCTGIAFTEYQKNRSKDSLDLGLLSVLSFVVYIVDFSLLLFRKKKLF